MSSLARREKFIIFHVFLHVKESAHREPQSQTDIYSAKGRSTCKRISVSYQNHYVKSAFASQLGTQNVKDSAHITRTANDTMRITKIARYDANLRVLPFGMRYSAGLAPPLLVVPGLQLCSTGSRLLNTMKETVGDAKYLPRCSPPLSLWIPLPALTTITPFAKSRGGFHEIIMEGSCQIGPVPMVQTCALCASIARVKCLFFWRGKQAGF